MKHLELHIIQSVPVACLNRDDLNSPKTAVFGGVQRARVSSQSWKRAIREMAKEISIEENSNLFNGDRTRRMVYTLQQRFAERGIPQNTSITIAEQIADIVETLDSKTDSEGYKKIKTVMFFSKSEYDAIADTITSSDDVVRSIEGLEKAINEKSDTDKDKALKAMGKVLAKGAIAKAIKSAQLKDAADIALFGRMVANDHSLTVEAASMFSHPLSTHKADNEIDFFSAVDDLQPKEESGAAMTSTLEFNSATYYRFAALNIDMLADEEHLAILTKEQRQSVIKTFIESTIKAIPSARKYTMNGNTMPAYVLGVIRETGHPIQLVNAFESAVRASSKGYTLESIERMISEYADLNETWGIDATFTKAVARKEIRPQIAEFSDAIDTCTLSELVAGMVSYVH
ncbi:MAG: type I-E CRISPR-associated protein Cas7/Cse4/CasC [Chromatiales bacterium]|nr:type I-E CRISPR-associated protein Cas7/Cse4/CasC [Gammaproteobacteria bacterium]